MQRSGAESIRAQIQPSKPKREITNITSSQNRKITYGQPSEYLFPKRWPFSNRSRTKNDIITRKMKRQRNSDTETRQQRITTNLPHWNAFLQYIHLKYFNIFQLKFDMFNRKCT